MLHSLLARYNPPGLDRLAHAVGRREYQVRDFCGTIRWFTYGHALTSRGKVVSL